MQAINKLQLKNVVGASDASDAARGAIISGMGEIGAVIGAAAGGTLGAVGGFGVGKLVGTAIADHGKEIVEGYAQGHKDAQFTGMPMAFQK